MEKITQFFGIAKTRRGQDENNSQANRYKTDYDSSRSLSRDSLQYFHPSRLLPKRFLGSQFDQAACSFGGAGSHVLRCPAAHYLPGQRLDACRKNHRFGWLFRGSLAGLLFRNCFRDPSSYFQDWFVQRNFEWNPLSFVWDFFADRTSIVIAVINLVLFVPLPILLYANHIKPRFWAALILFFAIELLQPALGQGFFSLGDILLYSSDS
jgi:hypothetical protein